jgi:hypothetical protein
VWRPRLGDLAPPALLVQPVVLVLLCRRRVPARLRLQGPHDRRLCLRTIACGGRADVGALGGETFERGLVDAPRHCDGRVSDRVFFTVRRDGA